MEGFVPEGGAEDGVDVDVLPDLGFEFGVGL